MHGRSTRPLLSLAIGALASLPIAVASHASAAPDVAQAAADPLDAAHALRWRFVGPSVGGRGTSVVGHPADQHVFFHGHSSGGLWRTDDAGQYWEATGEDVFGTGSIGAIAIAPSDPDVMYVGTGEPNLRDSVTWGDGVYRSDDGGRTWRHLGLERTRQIAKIVVHPEDADVAWVAAIGNPFGPGPDRGVYRTRDGGETWERVLYRSDDAGANDLVIDPDDPDRLYASIFEVQRRTWALRAGGPDSGIWTSTDGGDTWTDLTRSPGLPQTGDLGKIGLALSAAMPNRISALVDSETHAGVYQSNDRGATWELVSDDANITVRPFYFHHLYAHPSDGDELWVLTNKLWQSTDGGRSWTQRSGTKDDFHDMWIDPEDGDRMIVTHDGGVQVSLTAGRTWTGVYTQRNAQFYRVEVDDAFPYRLYGNGQDLIGYRVPSASVWGGISMNDVKIFGTGESGGSVPHPNDPDVVFHLAQSALAAGGGPIQRVNLRTEQYEHVNVWPVITFGRGQSEARYRFNWHAPIVIDPHDPETIYTAAEVVFRSRDRGQSWDVISPVLTFDDESKQQVGGSRWMPETSGQEAFNTIRRLAASPREPGVLWAGSDDGRLHVTRDGGETWQDASPDWPELSDVQEIEPSPHEPGTVYVATTRYRAANDFTPSLWKVTGHGARAERIDETFPRDEITRTIREDPGRRGLLFVGTETGVFVSFDDGGSWRRMNLDLPRVPVHDIKVKHEDLVIATHGRGFWILDDISPLRQWRDELARASSHLFTPRRAVRLGRNWWGAYGGGVGGGQKNYFVQNQRPGHTFIELGIVNGERRRRYLDAGDARPDGVIVYYLLSDDARDVTLEFLDAEGTLIRRFGADEIGTQTFETIDGLGYGRVSPADGSGTLGIARGLNRFVWDMTWPDATPVPDRPPAGIRPMARPGRYLVRLTVDGRSVTQPFELAINPNETWTRADTDARFELWMRVREIADRANRAIIESRALVEERASADNDVDALREAQEAFEGALVPVGKTLVQIANEPSKLLSKLATVHHVLYSSEGRPPRSAFLVTDELEAEIDATIATWDRTAAESR